MARRPAGSPGLSDDLIAKARAWAERSFLDQHLPSQVTDTRALREIASLLGAIGGSDPPDGFEPARVEPVQAPPAGADDDMIEHGGDDRPLPTER